jgi:LytS/YehU family sensor histidine kinase
VKPNYDGFLHFIPTRAHCVWQTGIGFMPNAEAGVGLANVRERLQALYNGRAELIIGVPPAGGTCATIKVPYEITPAPA